MLNIMVVGTKDGIVMVESGREGDARKSRWSTRSSSRTSEIKKICAAIEDLVSARRQGEARACCR